MSTHTPGPWRIQPTSMRGQYLVQGGDIQTGDEFSLQFSEGNARLVAAAPDLLAQLKEGVRLYLLAGFADSGQWVTDARAAIAKAEGKS